MKPIFTRPQATCRTAALSLAAALVLAGCQSSDAPTVIDVTGTVTAGGEPVPYAELSFIPDDGQRGSSGSTDDSGSYVLLHTRGATGAVIGTHEVTVSIPPVDPTTVSQVERERGGTGPPVKVLTKTVEVTPDTETLDFDIPVEEVIKARDGAGAGGYGQ